MIRSIYLTTALTLAFSLVIQGEAFAKKKEIETGLYQCQNKATGSGFQLSLVDIIKKKNKKSGAGINAETRGYYRLSLFDKNAAGGVAVTKEVKLYNLSLGALGDDATQGTFYTNVGGQQKLILRRNHSFINGQDDKVQIQVDYATSVIDKFDIRQVTDTGADVRIPARGETRADYSCVDLRTGRAIDPQLAATTAQASAASSISTASPGMR